ncbi:MAG: hypothetical protein NTW78_12505 [Campylobacterales bacterium]|nr:hypothetical protein [Campylobacterales bacterium]
MKIKNLKNYKATTELEKEVIKIIIDEASDYETFESYLSDLLSNGCVSGMVGALIYYTDTQAFTKRHASDINELLANTLSMCGFNSSVELFGKKWDAEDSLCLSQNNQNLMAWFALEETARNIGISFDLDVA